MFESLKNWFGRGDRQEAEQKKLEAEAKNFRLPSETLPQVFKYIFFAGLGLLNYRLFSHTVPGVWGQATGVVAMMAESIAIYATHNFSRSADLFRWVLGVSGIVLMGFSMVHGTFSILDVLNVTQFSEAVHWYSQVVAFPLLAGLLGVSVVAITMTHPRNIVRLKQALAHTAIVIGRANAASELELMRANAIVDNARFERWKEKNRLEERCLIEADRCIQLEDRKLQLVMRISNPQLREEMARDLGIDLKTATTSPPANVKLVSNSGQRLGNP